MSSCSLEAVSKILSSLQHTCAAYASLLLQCLGDSLPNAALRTAVLRLKATTQRCAVRPITQATLAHLLSSAHSVSSGFVEDGGRLSDSTAPSFAEAHHIDVDSTRQTSRTIDNLNVAMIRNLLFGNLFSNSAKTLRQVRSDFVLPRAVPLQQQISMH